MSVRLLTSLSHSFPPPPSDSPSLTFNQREEAAMHSTIRQANMVYTHTHTRKTKAHCFLSLAKNATFTETNTIPIHK